MDKNEVYTLEEGKYVFINELSKKYKGKEGKIIKLGVLNSTGHRKVGLLIDGKEYMLSSRALFYVHPLQWNEFKEVCKEYDESKNNKEDQIYRPRNLRHLLT